MSVLLEFNEWVERARRITVQAELERRGLWSRKMAGDSGVPCPACGGRDRFAVNTRKNLWFCRTSQRGGDALALAEYLDGSNFLAAVETVSGSPPPRSQPTETAEDRSAREKLQSERLEKLRRDQERQAQKDADYRETERLRCHRIWNKALPIVGTPADAYLARRGLIAPEGARLRFLADHPFWSKGNVLHVGPAMIGAMVAPDGRFAGIHQTWLDDTQPKGKACVFNPVAGETAAAKKTRGSWKGATVPLVQCESPRRLFLGEGIETVLSAQNALAAVGSPLLNGAEFHSACNLGNLGGLAADRVAHPTLRIFRRDGRDGGPRKVPGVELAPRDEDFPIIHIADSVTDLYLLGDGDSEPFSTRLALRRGGKRFFRAYPNLTVYLAMASMGHDFNDMWTARGEPVRGEAAPAG